MGSDRLERRTRKFLKPGIYEEHVKTLSNDAKKNTFVCDVASRVIRAIHAVDMKDRNTCVRACDYVWAAPPEEIPDHDKPYVVTKLIYWHNHHR